MTREVIITCIKMWWQLFFYSEWMYYALFLPIVMVLYQLVKAPLRKYVLLMASWFLFFSLSGWLLLYNIAVAVCCMICGRRIEEAKSKKGKKSLLTLGILIPVLILFVVKYVDFFGEVFGILNDETVLHLAIPVGISYYTLEAVSYLTDVYREEQLAERSFVNMALFLSFFPNLIEGPILKYSDIKDDLFEGQPIIYENIVCGYQRIWWGLFKKLMIADHLAPAVGEMYGHSIHDGSVALAAAVFFTVQEYADFSGTMDIVIGSARVFGIVFPENFRQPFFAKNASDFWRRWHITLGRFLRDYVFYPVSLSKCMGRISSFLRKKIGRNAAKIITPAIALFCVWLLNGLWHGPKWNYIFFGMYYFVIIFIENLLEKPSGVLMSKMKLEENGAIVRAFRFVKLFFIVIIGEMFFRAEDMATGWDMLRRIFVDFNILRLWEKLPKLGMDIWDYGIVVFGVVVLFTVDILKEKGVSFSVRLQKVPTPVRYLLWYAAIMMVVIFGAYGAGYDGGDQIYAMF